jgi:hypothetical protein
MPRRSFSQAGKGQVYCVEWPEWHVECAECESVALIASIGECNTAREAEKLLAHNRIQDGSTGWKKRNGLWYCPDHP